MKLTDRENDLLGKPVSRRRLLQFAAASAVVAAGLTPSACRDGRAKKGSPT
jgi:hypothetical protein